jgi:hypothetical protein
MPTTHRPLTNIDLADFNRRGLNEQTLQDLGWMATCDLAFQLAERTTLTVPQARVLVDAALNKMPVTLTWETLVGSRYDGWTLETTTTQVIVENILYWVGSDQPGRVRIQYWGFGHDVYMDKIVDAVAPEATRTYRAIVDA